MSGGQSKVQPWPGTRMPDYMSVLIHCNKELIFELSIWLPQLRDCPYYAMQCWKRIHAVGSDT